MSAPEIPTSPASLTKQVFLLIGALVLALAVTTGLALLAHLFGSAEPGRLARKLLVPLFALIYLRIARLGRDELREGCGWPFGSRSEIVRRYLLGWGAGVLSLLLLIALLLEQGVWRYGPSEDVLGTVRRVITYFFTGIVLVILEEGVFRGLVYQRLHRAGGLFGIFVVGSILFGCGHFLRPPKGRPMEGLEGALDAGIGCLAGLGTIPERWPECVGLCLVGLVLTLLRWRSGDIVVGMGVHAGWYYVRGVDGRFLRSVKDVEESMKWLYGGGLYYNGVLGWCALISVALLALRLRPKDRTSSEDG